MVGMKILCEGRCEVTFAAVAIKADAEGLGELEAPLGEGAGVKGMEVVVGVRMGIFVGVDLVVVLFVGEEGAGREGVVGGFGVAGAVLEEVLLVGWEVMGRSWCSFSPGSFLALFGGSFWWSCVCCSLLITASGDTFVLFFFLFLRVQYSSRQVIFLTRLRLSLTCSCSFYQNSSALALSRSVRIPAGRSVGFFGTSQGFLGRSFE